jgi:hypothetical protein
MSSGGPVALMLLAISAPGAGERAPAASPCLSLASLAAARKSVSGA